MGRRNPPIRWQPHPLSPGMPAGSLVQHLNHVAMAQFSLPWLRGRAQIVLAVQLGSRPRKPMSCVCPAASAGTSMRGPYYPEFRSMSSIGCMPASSSAQASGSRVASCSVARARSQVRMKTSVV
jgi:hypothetical protein